VSRRKGGITRDVLDTPQTSQHMTFLVDNLLYYLMADVLDTNY